MLFAASRNMFNSKNRCWRNLVAFSAVPYPNPNPNLNRGFCYAGPNNADAKKLIAEFYRVHSEPNQETRWRFIRKFYFSLFDPSLNNHSRALVMSEIERHNKKDKEDLRNPEHKYWRVNMQNHPDPKLITRDELVDSYINILSRAVGSEEEAKKRIYVVSTAWAFSFEAKIPEKEFRDKLQGLPEVESAYPVRIRGRHISGQPFVNGKAARYDPFYYLTFVDSVCGGCPQENAHYRYNPEIEESSRPCIEDEEDLNNPKHEYWRISMRNSPDKTLYKYEIIESYVNILAQVVGSKEEAKKRIFLVSTFFDFYFGALLPEKELRDKLEVLPEVGGLVPLDIKGRSRGEALINGKASRGYDPKCYQEFTIPGSSYYRPQKQIKIEIDDFWFKDLDSCGVVKDGRE